MIPKREYPKLESALACTWLKELGELHLEMRQTAVHSFSLADGTSRELGELYL